MIAISLLRKLRFPIGENAISCSEKGYSSVRKLLFLGKKMLFLGKKTAISWSGNAIPY